MLLRRLLSFCFLGTFQGKTVKLCRISQLNPSCWVEALFPFSNHLPWVPNIIDTWRSAIETYRRRTYVCKNPWRGRFFYRCKLALKKNIASFGIADLEPCWCFYRNDYPPFLVTITHHNLHLEVGIPIPPQKKSNLSPLKKMMLGRHNLCPFVCKLSHSKWHLSSSFGEVLPEPSPFPTRNPQNHLDGRIKPPGFK